MDPNIQSQEIQRPGAESRLVSILVRAKNDEAVIRRTLEGIFAQQLDIPFEVVVCVDESIDRTREIAAEFPVRFMEHPSGDYKPGRTLNALVQNAQGDIVVFNNSDAVPLNRLWLAELIKPLLAKSEQAVFTFANQMPRQDATALVRKDTERAYGDGYVQATWKFFFSLVSSATWRHLLLETPFDEKIQFSEDVEWTWRNSRRPVNPVEIVYCPSSLVEHSHNYTLAQLAKRFRGEGRADRMIFGEVASLWCELFGAGMETLRDFWYLAKRPRNWCEIPVAPVRRLVQRLSHWRGMREG